MFSFKRLRKSSRGNPPEHHAVATEQLKVVGATKQLKDVGATEQLKDVGAEGSKTEKSTRCIDDMAEKFNTQLSTLSNEAQKNFLKELHLPLTKFEESSGNIIKPRNMVS
ncbi:hypothetical protein BG003_000179, partial [Podila horticola]